MSSAKATQTSTKYYLYNPLTYEKKDASDDFNEACNCKDLAEGIWEVHARKPSGKNK